MKKHHTRINGNVQQDMLSRYLTGTCTEEERALVEQWYNLKASEKNTLPANLDLNNRKQEIWENINKQKIVTWPPH